MIKSPALIRYTIDMLSLERCARKLLHLRMAVRNEIAVSYSSLSKAISFGSVFVRISDDGALIANTITRTQWDSTTVMSWERKVMQLTIEWDSWKSAPRAKLNGHQSTAPSCHPVNGWHISGQWNCVRARGRERKIYSLRVARVYLHLTHSGTISCTFSQLKRVKRERKEETGNKWRATGAIHSLISFTNVYIIGRRIKLHLHWKHTLGALKREAGK